MEPVDPIINHNIRPENLIFGKYYTFLYRTDQQVDNGEPVEIIERIRDARFIFYTGVLGK